ncbi:hypothetical protein VTO73DRAFT_15068 [Trametes versicolor]
MVSPHEIPTMSLDMAQNASAVTDLIFAGLKVAGFSAVTISSVLGSYTIKYYWHKEKRMKKTLGHWRNVLSHLDEKQQSVIGRNSLRCMHGRLDQMERRLSALAINVQKTTLWSRTVGQHAHRVRKLERLVEDADADLTARTEEALRGDLEFFEPRLPSSTSLELSADPPAASVGGDQNPSCSRGHMTTPPCIELAWPSPALLASDRRLDTAQFTIAVAQPDLPPIPYGPDYGDDMV